MSKKTIAHGDLGIQEQPTLTIVKVNPTQQWMTEYKYSVDSSEYEERTYTGEESSIIAARDAALAEGGSSYQVTTTLTRLNAGIWQLQVRKSPIVELKEEDTGGGEEEEEEEEMTPEQKEWGSESNPKQLSISITAIQESVLNHSKFASLTPQQRGAIKAYMNGAMDGQKVADENGKAIRLGQILPMNDEKVQLALKCPTYFVPSIAVTLQYHSASAKTNIAGIGSEKTPPGYGKLPTGYTSLFMGSSSSPNPNGKGYVIQESYTIGKFNTELQEK